MSRAYIGLGSNLDNPLAQLRRATKTLAALRETTLARTSSIYSSRAVGPGAQPDYLNAAVALDTALEPLALLRELQAIEDTQGRRRAERWGARTLDLDLLLYDDLVLETTELTLPHPRLAERDFVLYPLAEISDTRTVLPGGADIDTLIAGCADNGLSHTGWQLGQ
ncbi:MAG: 2-amino-4-hydroxy-6-hydroxymethyldihydropteridine diphosphokinase [Halioglobus sp.]|nr:2-amino-4-hydroxy-6-hydroxymethyldihydropteridine diphosphokinase [Halioglobus sp.]